MLIFIAFILPIIIRPKKIVSVIIRSPKNFIYIWKDLKTVIFWILKFLKSKLFKNLLPYVLTVIFGIISIILAIHFGSVKKQEFIKNKNDYERAKRLYNNRFEYDKAIKIFEEIYKKGYLENYPDLELLLGKGYERISEQNKENHQGKNFLKAKNYYIKYQKKYNNILYYQSKTKNKYLFHTQSYLDVSKWLEEASRKENSYDMEIKAHDACLFEKDRKLGISLDIEGKNHSSSSIWNVTLSVLAENENGKIIYSWETTPILFGPEGKCYYSHDIFCKLKEGEIITVWTKLDSFDVVIEDNKDNNCAFWIFKIPKKIKKWECFDGIVMNKFNLIIMFQEIVFLINWVITF